MTTTTPHISHQSLADAYRNYVALLPVEIRRQVSPFIESEDLSIIEEVAELLPQSAIATQYRSLTSIVAKLLLSDEVQDRETLVDTYRQARAAALPATQAFLAHTQAIHELTRSHSLSSVDLKILKDIDRLAHQDVDFKKLAKQLAAKLGSKTRALNLTAYGQFFEVYGEALTLRHLRSRGLACGRVAETEESQPDLWCELPSGKRFYIEIKSLDVVGGEHRQKQMLDDNLAAQIEIEKQIKAGKRVASAETIVAPYRSMKGEGYDPYSLKLVVNKLRAKFRQAFKPSQFDRGPTFALAVLDRLLLPGGLNALAPYYYEPRIPGGCVSGVLWHVAFGKIGTPILRMAESEGAPSLEGYLEEDGLYEDPHQPFTGQGLIVLDRQGDRRVGLGLIGPTKREDWSCDDTEEAFSIICDAWNDRDNSRSFALSHPDQRPRESH